MLSTVKLDLSSPNLVAYCIIPCISFKNLADPLTRKLPTTKSSISNVPDTIPPVFFKYVVDILLPSLSLIALVAESAKPACETLSIVKLYELPELGVIVKTLFDDEKLYLVSVP